MENWVVWLTFVVVVVYMCVCVSLIPNVSDSINSIRERKRSWVGDGGMNWKFVSV